MLFRVLAFAAVFAAASAHAGLNLKSDRALVVDRDTGVTLYAKSATATAPIASVTKLMTAMVLLDEQPDLDALVTITEDDVDTLKNSSSRMPVGAQLPRRELLHLALMSSENRAAHALARTSAHGLPGFVAAMNEKARALGMKGARFSDPTGLSPQNRASAADLAKMLEAASGYEAIREFSTTKSESVSVAGSQLNFRNTNPVVLQGWDVLVQKTGFIREAGRVVVVGFRSAGRNVGVVLMGADTTAERTRDLTRVRDWVAGVPERAQMPRQIRRAGEARHVAKVRRGRVIHAAGPSSSGRVGLNKVAYKVRGRAVSKRGLVAAKPQRMRV